MEIFEDDSHLRKPITHYRNQRDAKKYIEIVNKEKEWIIDVRDYSFRPDTVNRDAYQRKALAALRIREYMGGDSENKIGQVDLYLTAEEIDELITTLEFIRTTPQRRQ